MITSGVGDIDIGWSFSGFGSTAPRMRLWGDASNSRKQTFEIDTDWLDATAATNVADVNFRAFSYNGPTTFLRVIPSGASSITIYEGGQRVRRTTVNDTNYLISSTDYIVGYRTLTGTRTATLPTAVNASGQVYVIKDEAGAAATFNIVVSGQAGQLINGTNTNTISTDYGSVSVYSNGTNWFTF